MVNVHPVLPKLAALLIVIQLLFLGNLSYLYGSVFKMYRRTHNFKFLAVDLDGGIIGESLIAAYDELKGDSFPSLEFVNASKFTSLDEIAQEVVKGNYWAAVYTNVNASNRLIDAVSNGGDVAEEYDPTLAITYVYNEARYPTYSDQIIANNLNILVSTSRIALNNVYGSTLFSMLKGDDNGLQALLNPIQSSTINLQPTTQGARIFLNTVSVAMMILQQFFLVLGPNMLMLGMGVYKKMNWNRSLLIRIVFGILSAFLSGLTTAGYYWGFRETWAVNGNQFVLTWLTIWLVNIIYHFFLYFVSCLVPLPAMPLVLVTFIFLNVTSTASPFDANPRFYRVGYALPAHQAYSILTDIWSGGRVIVLYMALPILFAWVVLVISLTVFAHKRMYLKLGVKVRVIESESESESREGKEPSVEL